ncbi:hypothetical protein [Thiobacillus sp. 65-1402]|uniref:hypothetical protein n=1 Tax=Thiobacillus sp. 65-1402 TaxID=1895861 RepID=UPI00095E1E36|nr:hypothetical protein [Thiobacillus sp. 65-1402]OJW97052.1 MAG: hypothetical protein BGO62_04410 [Thiobacillus sp. 65-1402]
MNDELSPEDELRLNVLFNTELKAVRIDESSMTLWALTPQGEASVPLKPNERSDRYLKRVREQLSGHALGSPGGYPVHLTRWTRQSQAGLSAQHLAQLLLIAEEEAVVAVVHSPALTDELARYAWWCMPTIENARLMLMRDVVCRGGMGRTLAEFLIEHLAFLHEDDVGILDTVAVMLVSGVLTEAERLSIWKRGSSRNSYYVAFLELQPDTLPNPRAARADHAGVPQIAGNPYSAMLEKALSGQGQTFLATSALVLDRPEIQEVVNHALNALAQWCAPLRQADAAARGAARAAVLAAAPQLEADCAALDALATADADSARPIFLKTTAIGSLMRRKIQPLVVPLLDGIAVLQRQP